MKERPILFSGSMVKPILEGRKTQTRRVVKNSEGWNEAPDVMDGVPFWDYATNYDGEVQHNTQYGKPCPYGKPGDILYVKETWLPEIAHSCSVDSCDCSDVWVNYLADGLNIYYRDHEIPPHWTMPAASLKGKNVPSLFMPRWASRILLEITEVRVERLNDISQSDAIAEGAPPSHPTIDNVSREFGFTDWSRSWFGQTWESINGKDSWNANPWVWVITFKKIEGDAK